MSEMLKGVSLLLLQPDGLVGNMIPNFFSREIHYKIHKMIHKIVMEDKFHKLRGSMEDILGYFDNIHDVLKGDGK